MTTSETRCECGCGQEADDVVHGFAEWRDIHGAYVNKICFDSDCSAVAKRIRAKRARKAAELEPTELEFTAPQDAVITGVISRDGPGSNCSDEVRITRGANVRLIKHSTDTWTLFTCGRLPEIGPEHIGNVYRQLLALRDAAAKEVGFKPGDRVRLRQGETPASYKHPDANATVLSVSGDEIRIRYDGGVGSGETGTTDRAACFERIPPTEDPKQKAPEVRVIEEVHIPAPLRGDAAPGTCRSCSAFAAVRISANCTYCAARLHGRVRHVEDGSGIDSLASATDAERPRMPWDWDVDPDAPAGLA